MEIARDAAAALTVEEKGYGGAFVLYVAEWELIKVVEWIS